MDKNIILIDFDHTLFNTTKFAENVDKLNGDINYKSFLYPDAEEFIKYASQYGTPVLFSEGELNFQLEKIKNTGIGKLFRENVKVYPSYGKMADIKNLTNGHSVVLIDDKPEIVDMAISWGYKVIRVKRGKYIDSNSNLSPTHEVESLRDIISKDLLKKI